MGPPLAVSSSVSPPLAAPTLAPSVDLPLPSPSHSGTPDEATAAALSAASAAAAIKAQLLLLPGGPEPLPSLPPPGFGDGLELLAPFWGEDQDPLGADPVGGVGPWASLGGADDDAALSMLGDIAHCP